MKRKRDDFLMLGNLLGDGERFALVRDGRDQFVFKKSEIDEAVFGAFELNNRKLHRMLTNTSPLRSSAHLLKAVARDLMKKLMHLGYRARIPWRQI